MRSCGRFVPSVFSQRLTPGVGNNALLSAKDNNGRAAPGARRGGWHEIRTEQGPRGGAAGRAGVGQEQQAEAAGGLLTHPASGRLLKPSLLPPPRVGTAVAPAC